MSEFRWATVVSTGPLSITLDGDTTPLPFIPDSLLDPLGLLVDDRVRCEIAQHRVIILGRSSDTVATSKVRVLSTTDASATSTGHGFQVGPDSGLNAIVDGNEMLFRNNGVVVGSVFHTGNVIGIANGGTGEVNAGDARRALGIRMAEGTTVVTPSAANVPTAVSVTYPAGEFTSSPTVVATPSTAVPGTTVTGVSTANQTETGCQIYVTRTNTTPTGVHWIAAHIS